MHPASTSPTVSQSIPISVLRDPWKGKRGQNWNFPKIVIYENKIIMANEGVIRLFVKAL